MVDIWQLDKVSDNNQQTWPEGTMEGNQINNAGRDDESLMARWYADWNGTLETAGTGTAYTATANTNRTAYGNDLVLALRIHADSGDNPTLNVSTLGAIPWLKNGGDQIKANDLRVGMLVIASYRDGNFYTLSSIYLGTAAGKDTGTAVGNVVELEDVGGNAGLPAVDGSQLTNLPTAYNAIGGLITSNNSGNPTTDVDIKPGRAADDANAVTMSLTSTLTKKINATFTEGTNQGGLDTGSVAASTTYAVWLIRRSDNGTVDALFSTSFTNPTLPTNYDAKRLIAAVITDGSSNIIAYRQVGDYFRLLGDAIEDVNDSSITQNTFKTGTLSAPPNSLAHVYGTLYHTGPNLSGHLYLRSVGSADAADGIQAFSSVGIDSGTQEFRRGGCIGQILLNDSREVQYTSSLNTSTAQVFVVTIGWTLLTRQEPL